jgi:hypothetical protein
MARAAGGAAGADGEELLHDPVLERMKRHDREPPAGAQHALGGVERAHELAELVVDGDAQALEHAGRGVDAAGLGPDEAGDELGELARRLDAALAAALDHGAGHRPRAALLAEMEEHVRELGLGGAVDEVGGAVAVALHAHVERPVAAEREAALGLVELHRRHADVEHDAVDAVGEARLRDDAVEVAEAGRHEREPALRLQHHAGAAGDRIGIAVDRDDAGARFAARMPCV